MAGQRVFLVEDDPDIVELVRYNLEKNGFEVEHTLTGQGAPQAIQSADPDVVLLDLMLPGLNGLDICATIKRQSATRTIPVVMLTAKGEEEDVVRGLEAGADDYVVKPFSPRVLVARIEAVLRRRNRDTKEEPESIRIHDLLIHLGRHEVVVSGEPVTLTSTEFRLLRYLAQRPGWVFTRNQIVQAVHGHDYPVTERSVDVQVVGLRKKLGDAGAYIETVRGVGYRFKE